MSAAPSLYRRHRPRTFSDVVGQEHVVRTLRNAITQDHVHHAYLFVGSRGTGKTSMAKILAAALNCPRRGDAPDPCGVCDSCRSIANATSLDVVEMDAASNNSVDDIRDLRERVAFAPVSGRSKVYILDEAHMLSPQAWNAFLKTLEEPPPHTVFVLATTEANKVLPTVVDRCHRFDFTRPTAGQIGAVLRRAAEAEAIGIPDEALALVARSATGSFRDALGTLEQLVAYSGERIALEDVLAVLGAADADLVFGALDAVASGAPREALLIAARVADSGRDLDRFFRDLEAHTRALLVVQTLGGEVPAELRLTADHDERLAAQARRVTPGDVVRLLDLIAAGLRATKDGSDARTQLELALVKAAAPQHDASTKALLARIERLEARLAAGHAPATPAAPVAGVPPAPAEGVRAVGPAPVAGVPVAPAEGVPAPSAAPVAGVAAESAADVSATSVAPVAGVPAAPVEAASAAPVAASPVGASPAPRAASPSAPPVAGPPAAPRLAEPPIDAEARGAGVGAPVAARAFQPATAAGRAKAPDVHLPSDDDAPSTAEPARPPVAPVDALDIAAIAEVWPAVVERLQTDGDALLSAAAGDGWPIGYAGGALRLGFPPTATFSLRKVAAKKCQDQLAAAVREVTGARVRIEPVVSEAPRPGREPETLSEDEFVARVVAEFDAEELPPEPEPKEA